MYLTTEALQRYNNDGFLFLPSLFSQTEVEMIKAELPFEPLADDILLS